MNLGDVSSRKPHDSSISFLSLVRRNDDLHACGVGLGKGVRQVRHFISSDFSAVGIRKVPVCDEHGELAKLRFNPHSTIGVSRSSDFYARSMRVVRGDSAARERKKTPNELVGFISGDIDASFGNRLERRVGWRCGMTIELSIDAARPLDYGVSPKSVVEGSDDDIRTGFASYTDSRIQVLDQIARALHAKRIRDWRLETKD